MPHHTASDSTGSTPITRRTAATTGIVTIAGVATACTQYGNPTTQPPASGSGGGTVLGKTADIPVGGGRIFNNEQIVVTQPAAGTFTGFSAVCTHQNCIVATVADGTINCACHGSKFNIADGSVANGPATSPLPQRPVTVTGDQITLS